MPSASLTNCSSKRSPEITRCLPTGVLHDPAAFASILRVERMRSDRSETPFALAVFSFDSADQRERCARFAEHLKTRVRATDHVGWMNGQRVAVILWDTLPEGAWSFVDKLAAPADAAPPQCEVFIYPTETSVRDGRSAAAGEAVTGADASPAAVLERLELSEELVQQLMAEPQSPDNAGRQVAPLEQLFVQPMPLWKRTIDVAASGAALLVLSPLLLAVAAAVKFSSSGPVIFKQQRSGRGGRPFTMYKFRSMVVDAEARKRELLDKNEQDGPAFKIENDPRITPVGHFIRKTSIDELPQLWNVLRGDMSLVGPRPLPAEETAACENWQRRRLEVTPGLTCIWQVQDRRTKIPFADWARMDIRYIGARTLKNDLRLVLKTFRSIFGRKGA